MTNVLHSRDKPQGRLPGGRLRKRRAIYKGYPSGFLALTMFEGLADHSL